ncbi:MAG: serine protease [Alphaproteobacteria bacterium]
MNRGIQALVVALLLAVTAGTAFNFWRGERQAERLDNISISFLRPEVLRAIEQSVYLVLLDGDPLATAWVVDAKCGTFVTNAHVAEFFDPKKKMTVKAPRTGREYEIKAAVEHTAHKAFEDQVERYGPISFQKSRSENGTGVPILPGYDVALLKIDADCPKAPPEAIAPALTLASAEELSGLHAGDPVALVGYAGSGSTTSWGEDEVVLPRTLTGSLRAVSSFVPTLAGSPTASVAINQALLHSILTVGGMSGSPVINAAGHVIGVSYLRVGPLLGTGERVAIRGDITAELIAGKDEARIDEFYRATWGKQLAQFESVDAWTPRRLTKLIEQRATQMKKKAVVHEVRRFDARLGELQDKFAVKFRVAGAGDEKTVSIDRAKHRFYRAPPLALDPKLNHLVVALNYHMTLQSGWCPIAFASRNAASDRFDYEAMSVSPARLFLKGVAANPDYDFVFFRPDAYRFSNGATDTCESVYNNFKYFVVSWEEADEVSALDKVVGFARRLGDRALSAFDRLRDQPSPQAPDLRSGAERSCINRGAPCPRAG